ncbi:uncharacterized protein EV420DRAFT_1634385 [Desarmillaria tabescens]|uniref:DUF6534 domain-containing protein n=1 Tax=Armillaria tabescens TaxID=1929756 RepID=A0AA39NR46_ARMTA|nr:uncharacterized protein EV420DRAFT_1634385 [Desarmillaria tabescens]KAK0469988.1 hypothetical protein EV420DRAFT_1634385 [Desarmillaria tabescens]
MSSSNPPQSVVNVTFGPLVTGVWMQQLLMGFILAQMADYYRDHFNHDTLFNKTIVSLLLFFNLFIGGLDFHVLYRTSVLGYGDYEAFDLQQWTMWTEPGFTAIVGFVAQVFFLVRCWRITKSTITVVFLTILVLFSFGSGLAVSGSFIEKKRFSLLGQFSLPITLWLISTSVADIGIASVLVFYLLQSRTSFKKTDAVIYRLVQMSMETSAFTAIVALLNLILFLPLQDTAYHLLPQFSMSRVYTLTVMVTLLSRTSLRAVLDSTGHASFATALRDATHDPMHGRIKVGVSTTVMNDAGLESEPSKNAHDIELSSVERSDRSQRWESKGSRGL